MTGSPIEVNDLMRRSPPRRSLFRRLAGALLPERDDLADIPAEVIGMTPSSWWRRLASLPDARQRDAAAVWRDLVAGCELAEVMPLEPLVGRRKGIFLSSQVLWDHLDREHSTWWDRYNGVKFEPGRGHSQTNFVNPNGAFVMDRSVEDFEFDITDINCLTYSKSSGKHFDDVDSFGTYFNDWKQGPIDVEGLDRMLSHGQIRLIHSPGSDHLELLLWDGRLILSNSGGSHHLAAAQMIARRIGQAVPLRGRLKIRWLNEPAWCWLLENFWVVHVAWRQTFLHCHSVAQLLGACYALQLPTHVAQGELVLLPKQASAANAVLELLTATGSRNVSEDLRQQLREQVAIVRRCSSDIPGLAQILGSLGIRGHEPGPPQRATR